MTERDYVNRDRRNDAVLHKLWSALWKLFVSEFGGETIEVQAAFLFHNLKKQVSDWFLFVIVSLKIEIEYCAVASYISDFAINIFASSYV